MLRKAKTTAPSLTVAALLLGLASPALADIPPPERRERETRTVEPHRAPPMTPPLEAAPQPEVEPPQPEVEPPQPETAPPPEPAPEPAAKPEPKAEAKAATEDKKSGNCSIDADSEDALAGIAALAMLIAGAALRRRR